MRRYLGLKYCAASNGCTHGQCHNENLSLSSAHVHIAPSLRLLMWIDLLAFLQAIASLCLKYRKHISLSVCVCGGGEDPPPLRLPDPGMMLFQISLLAYPFAIYLVSHVTGNMQSPAARCSQSWQGNKLHSHLLHSQFNHALLSCLQLWLVSD